MSQYWICQDELGEYSIREEGRNCSGGYEDVAGPYETRAQAESVIEAWEDREPDSDPYPGPDSRDDF